MTLTTYQRDLMTYVQIYGPRVPSAKNAKTMVAMTDEQACDWLDEATPQWRESRPPKTSTSVITAAPGDYEEQ